MRQPACGNSWPAPTFPAPNSCASQTSRRAPRQQVLLIRLLPNRAFRCRQHVRDELGHIIGNAGLKPEQLIPQMAGRQADRVASPQLFPSCAMPPRLRPMLVDAPGAGMPGKRQTYSPAIESD